MIVRRLKTPAIFAALGFAILLLALNLAEPHHFPGGSREPPSGPDVPFLPPTGMGAWTACQCVCPDCAHEIRSVQGRMAFSVVDRRGWYRLFWSGPAVWHYSEPSYFLTALENATCDESAIQGSWSVEVEYDAACRGGEPVLFCFSRAPATVKLEYRAQVLYDEAGPEEWTSDREGLVRIPRRLAGPSRPILRTGKLARIEWTLAREPEVTWRPCECPK